MFRLLPTLVLVLMLTMPLCAAEPPQPEQLPPPKTVTPQLVPPPSVVQPLPLAPAPFIGQAHPLGLPPVVTTRRSDYEVWQNLAVDRFGQFRPVVIMSPSGDYYRYNGKPYPWRTINPQNIMPYVTD